LLGIGCALALLGSAVDAQTIEQKRATLQALNARETQLTAQIGANRNELARLLSALQLFSRDPPPPLLVSPRDAKDAVRAMILARAVAPQLEARAKALAQQAQALAQARRKAAEAAGELFAAESAIEDREGRLAAVTGDAALMVPPAARLAAGQLDAQPPPESLVPPVAGALAVRYGGRLPTGMRARGVAWKTAPGAVVVSPAPAVVAYAGPLAGWGQVVILRGAGGRHMVLSGLGRPTVSAGQSVAANFRLGSMPTDGHAAPELYFEVRVADRPIDPATLLALAGGGRGEMGRGAIFNAAGLKLRREGVR